MYVILVYDFSKPRGVKMLKLARRYLHRVQNSVFEGELGEANLRIFEDEIRSIVDEDDNSCVVYIFRSTKYSERHIIGKTTGGERYFA